MDSAEIEASNDLMNTHGGQRQGQQGQGGSVHNGDFTGVNIENQTSTGNQNADDVNKGISQYAMSAHPAIDRSNTLS
jgi:hypothetical protein